LSTDFLESFAEKVISKYKAALDQTSHQSLKTSQLVEQYTQVDPIEISPTNKIVENKSGTQLAIFKEEETSVGILPTKTSGNKICVKEVTSASTQTNPEILITPVKAINLNPNEVEPAPIDLDCNHQDFIEEILGLEQKVLSHCPTEVVLNQEDEHSIELKSDNANSKSEMNYEEQVGDFKYFFEYYLIHNLILCEITDEISRGRLAQWKNF
jgi:hypothetical protein